jgi:uncharacterized protein (TIGR04255 family)
VTSLRPKKLAIEPIVEALAELRFTLPPAADQSIQVGRIYAGLGEDFPNMEVLPTKDLPYEFRQQNDSLIYAPSYRLVGDNQALLLGDRAVAFSMSVYGGWQSFLARGLPIFQHVLDKTKATVERVAVRYINLLHGATTAEQLAKTTLKIDLGGLKAQHSAFQFRTELDFEGAVVILQIATNAQTQQAVSGTPRHGLILDIDAIVTGSFPNWSDVTAALEKVHRVEKEVFFSLLTDQTLNEFKPAFRSGNCDGLRDRTASRLKKPRNLGFNCRCICICDGCPGCCAPAGRSRLHGRSDCWHREDHFVSHRCEQFCRSPLGFIC